MDSAEIIKIGVGIVVGGGLGISGYKALINKHFEDEKKYKEARMEFERKIAEELQETRDEFKNAIAECQRTFVAEIRALNSGMQGMLLVAAEDRKTFQAGLNGLREERHVEIARATDKLEQHFNGEIKILRDRNHEMIGHISTATTAVQNVAIMQAKTEAAVQETAKEMREAVGAIRVSIARMEPKEKA
jgi:hypothetical protein